MHSMYAALAATHASFRRLILRSGSFLVELKTATEVDSLEQLARLRQEMHMTIPVNLKRATAPPRKPFTPQNHLVKK